MKEKAMRWFIMLLVVGMTSCSSITGVGKDNAPAPSALVPYSSKIVPKLLWSHQAGKGTGDAPLNFNLAYDEGNLFTADYQGHVIAFDAMTGKQVWKTNLKTPLVAGPGVGHGVILVGGDDASLIALSEKTGKPLWRDTLSNNLTVAPVFSKNTAIIKTIDGQLYAVNPLDGTLEWHYNHGAPQMILAGGSAPLVRGNSVINAYADGKLAAYQIDQGTLLWETPISQPSGASDAKQMIDIVANPQNQSNVLYVVAYQGNLAAVDQANGHVVWHQPFPSFTGIAISSPDIFMTGQIGDLWSCRQDDGAVVWHQSYLRYRQPTAPVILKNTLVIADGEGYIHWISEETGQTIARAKMPGKASVTSTPMVVNNRLYILSAKGNLVCYTM